MIYIYKEVINIEYVLKIFNMGVFKRSVVLLIIFQLILWSVFAISYFFHQDAWIDIVHVNPQTTAVGGWFSTFLFIFITNSIICILIIVGNIFVRFGIITPGLMILLIQAVSIGWIAGQNGFEVPFMSVKEANLQFLKIGFWETIAYVLACSITLPKSLHIADTFPAKQWAVVRKFKDIKLSLREYITMIICIMFLFSAAIIETIFIIG